MSEGARLYDLCAARRLKEDLAALESHNRAMPQTMRFAAGQLPLDGGTAPSGNHSIIIGGVHFTYVAWGGSNV